LLISHQDIVMPVALRPTIFIGSSSEGLHIARALQLELDHSADTEIWSQGVFGLTRGTLETLCDKAKNVDFAVLVLTPDDMLSKREVSTPAPRDNVIFELGLFLGALGRERTFIVHQRGIQIDLPTDLAGITSATFHMQASGNIQSSVGAATTMITNHLKGLGATNKLSALARKKILTALETFFAPFMYCIWRKRRSIQLKANQPVAKTETPGALDFELLRTHEMDWPNIFFDSVHCDERDHDFDPKYSSPPELCPAAAYDMFRYPWLKRFHGLGHELRGLKVIDLFRECTAWGDSTLTETVSIYRDSLSTPLLAAIEELKQDSGYLQWTNIRDGLSHPGYARGPNQETVSPEWTELVQKGIAVRELARNAG
jgi:hypothetical protein